MTITEGLSYDDILLVPSYSEIMPYETDIATTLTSGINLSIPILSASMDTVTEARLAIALALEGGAGVIHKNLTPEDQADQIAQVKKYLNWIIEMPVTVSRNRSVAEARTIMEENNISGLPVLDDQRLCGILTNRDLRFCQDNSKRVDEVMTADPIVETDRVTPESAQSKFDKYKIEKLPVVDDSGELVGLITVKDIEKHQRFPHAAIDVNGRLIVGAAVSPFDYDKRISLLLQKKVDFVVVDTAHGDSKNVIRAVEDIKKKYKLVVIAGNIATPTGTRNLINAGVDGVKVGVGPGSICTTRVVAGIGVPQFSAVYECAEEAKKYGIPVIADGGIKYSGDITKAIAAGASSVMIGNLFAGLKETPGREIIYEGRMFKEYRGMGSIGAIKAGSDRYKSAAYEDPVPEGIEGRVAYKGELKPFLHQLITGLKRGMGYCGCNNIHELQNYKKFVRISSLGLKESHPHDVVITQEAPNYTRNTFLE